MENQHEPLEKMSSTAPMLPEEKIIPLLLPNSNGTISKILIREDTIFGKDGCAGCGRRGLRCTTGKSWSAICWGGPSEKKYTLILLTLSAIFIMSFLGTIFFGFTNLLNDAVISNMALVKGSTAYELWEKPSVRPLLKVHIFNYTNVDEMKMGLDTKLRVKDIGPFVYAQTVERVNVKFNHDGTLTYQEKYSYEFLANMSGGLTQYDRVVVPNLPLLGVIHKLTAFGTLIQLSASYALNPILLKDKREAFIELAAHRFLWGYEDPIISNAQILKYVGQMPFEKFGFLMTQNGTMKDKITIHTGEKDINKLNFIDNINGINSTSHWGTPECNSLEGTDGTIFPVSLLDRRQTLYVYKKHLCRRLPFVYEKDVEVLDGIQALRYTPPDDVFDDPYHNSHNQCYCDIDSGTCPPKGTVNVSFCALDMPILASFPHFYLGDERLLSSMDGLHPDPALHKSFLDVHPTLGLPLNVRSALQVNFVVPKTEITFPHLVFLKAGQILPIAWIEASLGTIPQGIRTLVYHGTYSTAAAQLALTWCCVILLLMSGTTLVILVRRKRRRPCVVLNVTKAVQ